MKYATVTVFAGALYPTSMRINSQGQLVVNFRTEARFRGLFVFSHPGMSHQLYNMQFKCNAAL